ncbi:putative sugar O-methyltransferase [Azospirillum isscasi]|uniref:Sugar O-methyltransferase n=1 Tax=Azospirillum isscasi TaxID=3053926 RepID=A0ABU0WMA3_9PROT|nr:putative sugar O-methyltransferase [Azospirillum isscasi]MDQ2105143.1 putative sugar O-methyltransferase [Azospirillum isscasi]
MPTSISDNSDYRSFCQHAAEDAFQFSRFRHSHFCIDIVDTLSAEHGASYMNLALKNDPQIYEHLDELRRNDEVGSPLICNYSGIGKFCPTTLRYIMVATALKRLFGTLNGMHVVEVGGGYGGQCRIINALFKIESYTIIDLPEALKLTERYLSHFNLKNTSYVQPQDVQEKEYDLFISNYAYSELSKDTQDDYFDKVLSRSYHGYMIYNQASFSETAPNFQYTAEEIASRIPYCRMISGESGLAHTDIERKHKLLYW